MRKLQFALLSLLIALAAAPGCGPPEDDPDTGTPEDTGMMDSHDGTTDIGPDTGPDAGDTSMMDGGDTADGGPDGDAGTAPTFEDVSFTANPKNVLSAFVNVETDPASKVTIDLERDGEVVRTVRSERQKKANHELFVLGMYAETEHTLTLKATANGKTTTREETYTPGSLPDDFPPLQVKTANPDLAADGYRLMDTFRWKKDGSGGQDGWGYAIALDEHGKVVWYYKADRQVWDITRTSQGTLTFNDHHKNAVEINMKGEVLDTWSAKEDLNRELNNNECCLHHGVSHMENGNFLGLSTEMKEIDGYMPNGDKAKSVADVAVEFNRSGEVVNTWSMFDVLSEYTTRKRVGSLGPYWDDDYGQDVKDWTHGNAVEPGDTDGTFIASLRHQDWVVKWDQSGELLWRLGPEGDFEFPSSSNGEFQYHQHAPHWLENGNLLVYDNGNARESIEQGNQYYTRVVEYELDASNVDVDNGTKGTVKQVWSYKNDPKFYAPYVGDADPLPNGNILIGDGGVLGDPSMCIKFDGEGNPVDQTGKCIGSADNLKWARLHEVTHDADKKTALEVWIKDTSDDPRGYTMYRSDYLETLKSPIQSGPGDNE